MAVTRTFSIIKPDATRRNLTGAVTKLLEEAGLRVVAAVVDHLTYHVADVERLRQLRLVPLLLQVRGGPPRT